MVTFLLFVPAAAPFTSETHGLQDALWPHGSCTLDIFQVHPVIHSPSLSTRAGDTLSFPWLLSFLAQHPY